MNFTLQNSSELDDGSSKFTRTPHKTKGITAVTSKSTYHTGIELTTRPAKITNRLQKNTPALTHNEVRKVKIEDLNKLKRNQNKKLTSATTIALPTVTTGRTVHKGIAPKSSTPHTILTKVFVIPIQEEASKSNTIDALETVKKALNKAAKRSEPRYKKHSNDEKKHKKRPKKLIHHSAGKRKFRNFKNVNKAEKKENKMNRKKSKHYIFIRHYKRRAKRKHLKRMSKKLKARKGHKNKKSYKHHINNPP